MRLFCKYDEAWASGDSAEPNPGPSRNGRTLAAFLLFATASLFPVPQLVAQSQSQVLGVNPALVSPGLPVPAPIRAGSIELTATDGGGTERHLVSNAGLLSQLVLNPNQNVPVTLQFPSDKIGMPVAVGSLDGGEVTGAQPTVLPTGKMLFTFRGTAPGLYRLLVRLPAEQYRLEVYVIDPHHPRRKTRTPMNR
jgi:hypothetical protein